MAKGKIIVYDPKVFYRAYIIDLLEREDFETESADNIRALGRVISSFSPDLVIMDITELKDKDIDFLDALKKSFPTMPMITLVETDKKDLVVRYIRTGVFDCVEKPVVKEELFLAVNKAIEFSAYKREQVERVGKLKKLARGSESLLHVGRQNIPNVPLRYPGNKIVQSILDSIAAVFDAEKVSLSWLDRAKRKYDVVASAGHVIETKSFKSRALGEGIIGYVADVKEAVYVPDIRLDKRFNTSPYRAQYKSNSFMCGPVFLNHEVVAVVSAGDKKDGKGYTEEDFLLFKSFLMQISYVLESSLLIDNLEANAARLKVYKELFTHIVNLVDTGDILKNMLNVVLKYLGAEGCALYIIDENREHFIKEAAAGMSFKEKTAFHKFLNKFLEEMQSSAGGKGINKVIENLAEPAKLKSFVSMPILLKNFPLGFLLLANLSDEDLDCATLSDICQLVSVAFKNNWLYKNLCMTADELVNANKELEELNRGYEKLLKNKK